MHRSCFPTRRQWGTVRLRCPREGLVRTLEVPISSAARLQHALMAFLAQGCAEVLLVRVVLCDVLIPELIDFCTFLTFDRLANCDASELLANAETAGNCSAALPSGTSCTNTAVSGFTCATSSSCLDGTLTLGLCVGTCGAKCEKRRGDVPGEMGAWMMCAS
jgi:hypothetical protein